MKITFSYGKSVKWVKGDFGHQKPAFGGFNWWLWAPFIRLRFKRYGIHFDFSQFCYWWSVFLSYHTPKEEHGNQASASGTLEEEREGRPEE